MVSSRAKAKKVSADICRFSRKFFDDFYAKAANANRHPLPFEAMAALGRILHQSTAEFPEYCQTAPKRLPHQLLPDDAFEALLDSNLFQQMYLDACAAYGRHTPGLKIKMGKPGRPPDSKAQDYFEQHAGELSYADIAKQELQSVQDGEAKTLLIEKESERIRASVRRTRRRQSKQLPRT